MAGLRAFKERIMNDKSFASKFSGVSSPEEVVSMAAREGFTFTVADVKNNTELTDAELSGVAGGSNTVLADGYFVNSGGGGATIFAPGYFVKK